MPLEMRIRVISGSLSLDEDEVGDEIEVDEALRRFLVASAQAFADHGSERASDTGIWRVSGERTLKREVEAWMKMSAILQE
jgi:hypothetical protein